MRSATTGVDVPLGEFADSLASLMPGVAGPGARSPAAARSSGASRRRALERASGQSDPHGMWIDGSSAEGQIRDASARNDNGGASGGTDLAAARPARPPQLRSVAEPEPTIASDGSAVVRYPFELRSHGNRVRLSANVEIMSSDGGQVESEAPLGAESPVVRAWIDPSGAEHAVAELETAHRRRRRSLGARDHPLGRRDGARGPPGGVGLKTPPAPPYLLPPHDAIVEQPWLDADGRPLGDRLEHWDPFTDTELDQSC